MDNFNNDNKNPFEEQNTNNDQGTQDQYGSSGQNSNPYSPPPSSPYPQDPYNYSSRQNTYNRQNFPQQGGYSQPGGGYYGQNNGGQPYPGYQNSPYGNQYYPYQPPVNQSTGMATASMVCGICSIVFALFDFSFPPLFLLPIIGLILGIVFKCKHLPTGKGASTAGIITSIIGLLIPVLLIILMVALLLSSGPEIMEYIKNVSPEEYNELYELYGEQFPEWFSGAMRFFGLM